MKEYKDFVVVITLNYNQTQMTLECIDSILKSDYKNYKLIVVDNGSSLQEYNMLINNVSKDVSVKRIDENCGYVGGVNYGLSLGNELNADFFLIMNNDTVIDADAIKNLVDAGNRYDKNAIISGKVYHFERPNILQYVGGIFKDERYLRMNNIHMNEKDIGQCDVESERDMLDDIFWLLPTKIATDIGSYSKNFFLYGEQADYALRAVGQGYKLIYTPNAKIWHKGSITTGGGNRVAPVVNFWRKKSNVIYLYRNTKRKYFYKILIKNFFKLILKNLKNIFSSSNRNHRKSDYAGLIGYIYGIKWLINKKPDNGFNPFL